uniref:Uncharacterized protein n=1 Tax=Strongyloides papillosus TaxID=174720 RepID=A0A0N5BBI8_STREA
MYEDELLQSLLLYFKLKYPAILEGLTKKMLSEDIQSQMCSSISNFLSFYYDSIKDTNHRTLINGLFKKFDLEDRFSNKSRKRKITEAVAVNDENLVNNVTCEDVLAYLLVKERDYCDSELQSCVNIMSILGVQYDQNDEPAIANIKFDYMGMKFSKKNF